VGHDVTGTVTRRVTSPKVRDNEAGYFTDFLRVPPPVTLALAIALIRQHIITSSVSDLALASL
jgi:hypothetical protein